MEGDFTRNSDDPEAAYSGVLMQQGRVQLDADWNEQAAIQTRALRDALRDLIGSHGGPADDFGFAIASHKENDPVLTFGGGVYYVDGIRVAQHGAPLTLSMAHHEDGAYIAFLDVWERHVNAIEDPHIREVALLGPDTATRVEVLWRVRLLKIVNDASQIENLDPWADNQIKKYLRSRPRRHLAAHARTVNANTDPCQLSPLAQYRGRENQLYRVQIHDGFPDPKVDAGKVKIESGKGKRGKGKIIEAKDPAGESGDRVLFTFKWSRDNGSVVFPIVGSISLSASQAEAGDHEIEVSVPLGNLGRDERFGLKAGDIVEFVHDALTRETLDDGALIDDGRDPGRPGLLGRVLSPIDRDDLTVRIAVYADDISELVEATLYPYLRRWDHGPTAVRSHERGAIAVRQSDLDKWLPLEDGVEVWFDSSTPTGAVPQQRAGDYWQIPARAATGDVLWPTTIVSGNPSVRKQTRVPPHGPHHHYAPLLAVMWESGSITTLEARRIFPRLALPGSRP